MLLCYRLTASCSGVCCSTQSCCRSRSVSPAKNHHSISNISTFKHTIQACNGRFNLYFNCIKVKPTRDCVFLSSTTKSSMSESHTSTGVWPWKRDEVNKMTSSRTKPNNSVSFRGLRKVYWTQLKQGTTLLKPWNLHRCGYPRRKHRTALLITTGKHFEWQLTYS